MLFGVLTCQTREQARERAEAGSELHYSLSMSALHMACMRMQLGLRGKNVAAKRELGVVATVPPASLRKLRVALVRTSWNENNVLAVVEALRGKLLDAGVRVGNITEEVVPGSHELPFTAQKIVSAKEADVVCLLGSLVKGDVENYDYMAAATIKSFLAVQRNQTAPVVWGVRCVEEGDALALNVEDQAALLSTRIVKASRVHAELN